MTTAAPPLRLTNPRVNIHNDSTALPMKIGFTGTQQGMTHAQRVRLDRLLVELGQISLAMHGDCIGSDAQFHHSVRQHSKTIHIKGHPPTNPQKRAWLECDSMADEYPYLVRNHHIVNESDVIIATPKESYEVVRSGTWGSVRYARKLKKPVWIITPAGEVIYTTHGG